MPHTVDPPVHPFLLLFLTPQVRKRIAISPFPSQLHHFPNRFLFRFHLLFRLLQCNLFLVNLPTLITTISPARIHTNRPLSLLRLLCRSIPLLPIMGMAIILTLIGSPKTLLVFKVFCSKPPKSIAPSGMVIPPLGTTCTPSKKWHSLLSTRVICSTRPTLPQLMQVTLNSCSKLCLSNFLEML